MAQQLPFLSRSQPFVFHDAKIVLIAGAMICAIGTLDDLFELDALTKLGGQVLAAGFLILNGIQYFLFPLPGGGQFALDPAQGALLTAFVVVGTVNAVNMVDGLDGLATGVVGIGSLAFFAFCYQLTNLNNASLASTGALLSAMLAGVCVGFLPHNINPARVFMGDSGSMLIGLVLSASAITLTGQYSGADLSHGAMGSPASLAPTFLPLALPVALLMVPIADLVLAVIRRTRAGRSPFAPDKQHLHHRLLEIGHSQRRAVLIMWMWAALVAWDDRGGQPLHRPVDVGAGRRSRPPSPSRSRSSYRCCTAPTWPSTTRPDLRGRRTPDPFGSPPGACASFHKHPDTDQNGRHRHDDRGPLHPIRERAVPPPGPVRGPLAL